MRLCPGCEESVKRPSDAHEDAAGRPWHPKCANRALAEHFRTPLTEIEASKAVDFEVEVGRMSTFPAPHSFHLREIVMPDGGEVSRVFVGQVNCLVAIPWGEATHRAKDLPDRSIVIDHDVSLGLHVMVDATPGVYRLIGERRPEKSRPKPSPKQVQAVALLRTSEEVPVGGTAECSFVMPLPFRADRVACDEAGWDVTEIRLGTDPGAHRYGMRLDRGVTWAPAYVSRAGEIVTYVVKNHGKARKFEARVYGVGKW